jgi:hypothetical protein
VSAINKDRHAAFLTARQLAAKRKKRLRSKVRAKITSLLPFPDSGVLFPVFEIGFDQCQPGFSRIPAIVNTESG